MGGRKVPDRAEDAWLVILHWDDFPDSPTASSREPTRPAASSISSRRRPLVAYASSGTGS